jgi:hypothetical protein
MVGDHADHRTTGGEGRVMPEGRLVDYHGSIRDRHGRYLRSEECACSGWARMWAEFLNTPEPDVGSWDPRWLLRDPDSGSVVLCHVRPESFTAAPAG